MAKDAQKDAQTQGIAAMCEVGNWLIDGAKNFYSVGSEFENEVSA